MLHTDIDPSLRTSERMLDSLDDGFSPPEFDEDFYDADDALPPEFSMGDKSLF